jgi:branched-chain amino acid transport system permease protein
MTLFGGPGTVFGPVIGAFVLSAIYEVLASKISTVATLFYGFVIVLAVIFMPKGLLDVIQGLRESGVRYFGANMRRFRL